MTASHFKTEVSHTLLFSWLSLVFAPFFSSPAPLLEQ